MRRLTAFSMCAGVFLGLSAAAATPDAAPDPMATYVTGGVGTSLRSAAVSNEPFSAMWTKEMTQTLPDGTKVTKHGHHLVARDSQGRTRIEERLTNGKDGKPEIKMIYLTDPVAKTFTTWTEGGPGKKVAFVTKLPDRKPGEAVCGCVEEANSSRPARVETKTELGSQVFGDVAVHGELRTIVMPAGRVGNDKAITKTHELWASDEMKVVLKQKWEDPRTGEQVVEMKDLKRAEPAAALFRVPAGYETKTALESLKEMMAKLETAQQ